MFIFQIACLVMGLYVANLPSLRLVMSVWPMQRVFHLRSVYKQTKLWPVDVENNGYTDELRREVESFWGLELQKYIGRYHSVMRNGDE